MAIKMKGLILAAGLGKRLRPMTDSIPKALIPVGGRPLIAYPLLKLKQAGIEEIGIVIRPRDYLKFKSGLGFLGLKIDYIFQEIPQGTARALQCAKDFISENNFLLCWCDFLSPFDYKKIIKAHLHFKPIATILINKEKDPSGTAQVLFNGVYIRKIVEKPLKPFSSWGSAGLLALEPEVFSAIPKIKPSAQGEYHIADVLQYLIQQGKEVRFVKLDTWRINVNSFKDLKLAEAKITPGGLRNA